MAMKREVSLGVGLATAALVYAVYQKAMPPLIDVRAGEPGDQHAASTERAAAWTATAVVAGISLLSKDPTVFVIGGSTVIVMSWLHRHANNVNPMGGSGVMPSSRVLMDDANMAGAGYSPSP